VFICDERLALAQAKAHPRRPRLRSPPCAKINLGQWLQGMT